LGRSIDRHHRHIRHGKAVLVLGKRKRRLDRGTLVTTVTVVTIFRKTLTADPAGIAAASYVRNRPLNVVDPTGMKCKPLIGCDGDDGGDDTGNGGDDWGVSGGGCANPSVNSKFHYDHKWQRSTY